MCTQTANLRIKTHTRTTAAPAKRVPFLVSSFVPAPAGFAQKFQAQKGYKLWGFHHNFEFTIGIYVLVRQQYVGYVAFLTI